MRPDECVVIEDSDVGKAAATASGAVLCSVNDPADVNYYRVMRTIREADRVNVVIPAAGQGKRFAEVGYQHPKPLIDVEGRPMIDLVLENFRGVGRPIVLLQDRHVEQYCADSLIKSLAPDGEVVGVDGLTEGAACTVLLAEQLIDNANELVLANSDQVVDVSIEAFVREMRDRDADGGILTFRSDHPKWSYARTEPTRPRDRGRREGRDLRPGDGRHLLLPPRLGLRPLREADDREGHPRQRRVLRLPGLQPARPGTASTSTSARSSRARCTGSARPRISRRSWPGAAPPRSACAA